MHAQHIQSSSWLKLSGDLVLYIRRNHPPGSSGRELGDAAHRLVVNSLQMKVDSNGYRHPHNGPPISYPAPMGHRPPVSSYGYESHPGYVAMPPVPAPSLHGRPHFAPYNAQQYGYNQQYLPPPVPYNPHQPSNSYERNDYQHPGSHHYERNQHQGSGGRYNQHQSSGYNQNARFINNTQGAYGSHHHDVSHHHQVIHHNPNFQPSRTHQSWTPRNNQSGNREYGHHSSNQFSLLDRRGNRNPMPPPGYDRQ